MKLVWVFITIGGLIGGYIPVLFGQSDFSILSIITGGVGSLVGVWIYTKLDLE
jgi:uncharacterized membrane protein YeaQ/YmgE (transglycosylase-associated protein family)